MGSKITRHASKTDPNQQAGLNVKDKQKKTDFGKEFTEGKDYLEKARNLSEQLVKVADSTGDEKNVQKAMTAGEAIDAVLSNNMTGQNMARLVAEGQVPLKANDLMIEKLKAKFKSTEEKTAAHNELDEQDMAVTGTPGTKPSKEVQYLRDKIETGEISLTVLISLLMQILLKLEKRLVDVKLKTAATQAVLQLELMELTAKNMIAAAKESRDAKRAAAVTQLLTGLAISLGSAGGLLGSKIGGKLAKARGLGEKGAKIGSKIGEALGKSLGEGASRGGAAAAQLAEAEKDYKSSLLNVTAQLQKQAAEIIAAHKASTTQELAGMLPKLSEALSSIVNQYVSVMQSFS